MVNKNRTLTVAELLGAIKDGRITMDMPLAVLDCGTDSIRGVSAFEIHTHKDGSQSLTFCSGANIAVIETLVSTAEVFP